MVRDDRQGAQAFGPEAFDGTFARFPVPPPVGDFGEPLPRLEIHTVQVRELAQWPQALAGIADGPLHFPFFRARGHVAGSGEESKFTGESGDGGRQIAIGDFVRDTSQRGRRMCV